MLCYFAHKFPPFVAAFLQRGRKLRRRFREETITDLMMGSLLSLGGTSVIVEFPDEPVTGADMQWDFVNRSARTFFRILIQAKQSYGDGRHWSRHCYRELLHKVGHAGPLQAKLLCDSARGEPNAFPLYVLYHPDMACDLARAGGKMNLEGVNLADGFAIENLVTAATTPTLRTRNKSLGTIQPFLFSLTDLFCPPLLRTMPAMGFSPGRPFGPFFMISDGRRPLVGLPLPPRPEDVRQRLVQVRSRVREVSASTIISNLAEIPPLAREIPRDVLRRIEGGRRLLEAEEPSGLDRWRVTFVSDEPAPDVG